MGENHSKHDVEVWVKRYKKVGVALFFLTIITVLASYLPVGATLGISIGLAIALFKGSLVMAYFMHLIEEKPMIIWLLIITVLIFLKLIIIPVLWHNDPITINYQ